MREHAWDLADGYCHNHRRFCDMTEETAMPKRRLCPHCGGAGEIEIRAFVGGASPFDRRLPCGFCDATGYVTPTEWRRYQQRQERTR